MIELLKEAERQSKRLFRFKSNWRDDIGFYKDDSLCGNPYYIPPDVFLARIKKN